MEGGVSGTLGTPLSLLETLWASINETSMKEGAHLMTPMTYLTLLFTTYPFHHFTPTATVKSFPLKGLNHLVLLALLWCTVINQVIYDSVPLVKARKCSNNPVTMRQWFKILAQI